MKGGQRISKIPKKKQCQSRIKYDKRKSAKQRKKKSDIQNAKHCKKQIKRKYDRRVNITKKPKMRVFTRR